MIRRMLNAIVMLGVIGVVVVFAARVAEPSVRPVLYPVSASPATLVASAAVEAASPADAAQTSSVDTASTASTTVAPVATVPAPPTTAVPASVTTVPPTTTLAPVDEVAVLTASYAWGLSADAVVLQRVLGVEADGWYGPATRAAHIAENEARGLPVDAVATAPTTTTTVPPTTMVPPTTTAPPATTTTVPPTTTAAAPTTTVPPPSTTAGMFGNLGAQLMAQLLGQPCIADGDLSDCGPEVDALVRGLVG